jgi:hypothetical protein
MAKYKEHHRSELTVEGAKKRDFISRVRRMEKEQKIDETEIT